MVNQLSAPRNGVVKTIFAKPGATLAVDENIMEFE